MRQLATKLGITGVKNTIVISSAKGGVGKSSTTVGLGTALKQLNPVFNQCLDQLFVE